MHTILLVHTFTVWFGLHIEFIGNKKDMNIIGLIIIIDIRGKLTFNPLNPLFSKKSGKLKTGYKRDYVNLGCDVDFEGPIIHAAAVLGYEGWLAGYQMAFDTAKSKLAQNNFALGYRAGDFQLHTNV